VLVQRLRIGIALNLLALVGSPGVQSSELPVAPVSIHVSVYDDTGLGPQTIREAEEVSSTIFAGAGIEVHWLNCSVHGELTHVSSDCAKAKFPDSLQLRFRRKAQGGGLPPDTLGVSYLMESGDGCYSQVFVEPVERLRSQYSISLGTILGDVATHEIAHLLLGTNAHSVRGIMRPNWGLRELESASMGTLVFYPEQREKMAARMTAGLKRNDQLMLAGTRGGHGGSD
jgi:hypothetical protein